MQLGLIGKPNVGKSAFFKAATLRDVEIADYPFTTIRPNVGVAHVSTKCPREGCSPRKGSCLGGTRFVPVRLYDVAGLVPGAHRGKGLGNQFLDDARKAQVLIMVVDTSGRTDKEGNEGRGNPVEDVKFIEDEFDHWTAGIVKKLLRNKGGTTEEALLEGLSGLEMRKEDILAAMDTQYPTPKGAFEFARILRHAAKPLLIAANRMDLEGTDSWLKELEKLETPVVPTSSATEILLRKAAEKGFIDYIPGGGKFEILKEGSPEQKNAIEFAGQYINKYGSTGVQEVLNLGTFKLGKMIPVFPVEDENKWVDSAGNVLPDCFLVRRGTTAKELAYRIHTDIGDRFVKAVDCRSKRAHGADYVLQAGDVLKISTRR